MKIKMKEVDGITVLNPSGEMYGGPENMKLVDTVMELADEGVLDLVINLAKVKWISSTGLGIMVYPSGFRGKVFSGVAWGTLAGFTFAILSLLNRKWVRDYPPVVIALYQNFVATLVLLPMLALVDLRLDARQIGLLVFLGVICTALSHALFIRGLRFVRARPASRLSR